MNIVVTGGNGFIGRKLVAALSDLGHNVRILSRKLPAWSFSRVESVTGDLRSELCPLSTLLENCEVIFHCAGELWDVSQMYSLHVEGTQRLLKAAVQEARQRGRKIHWVQLSSVGAYGFPQQFSAIDRVVTENTPVEPIGVYEVTKTQADEIVIRCQDSGYISCTVVRPSKVFGPGRHNRSIESLASAVRKGLFFYIGRPGAVATYVHVEDVVEVLLLCGLDERAKGKIFNISNDCYLEEMIGGLAMAVGVATPKMRLPEKPVRMLLSLVSRVREVPLSQDQISGLVRRTRYPYLRLQEELGFSPKRSVPKTIAEGLF